MENLNKLSVKVSHRSISNLFYETTLNIKHMMLNERLLNGFKYFCISLLAAGVFVFIPVLHFILVPSAVIIGVFMFYRQMTFKEFRFKTSIPCPECNKNLSLKSAPIHWPMREGCNHCRAQILITRS